MTTLQTMIDEIESDTERSDTVAITAKIEAAIRHYQPRRLFFNESRSITFNTVASTDTYRFGTGLEITTEFYRIDSAWITIAAEDVRELTRRNYADLEGTADNNTDEGEPSDYAFINEAIRLWRNPDDAYEVRLTGHVKIAPPGSAVVTGNAWMVEGYDLIMCRAKAELYAHRWEDPANAQLMRIAEMDAFNRLKSATDDKVEDGHLAATEF